MSDLRIATILPIPEMWREQDSDYHMALAHLADSPIYSEFFRKQSERGAFVLMDNGVVETGKAMQVRDLFRVGREIKATQICLPDKIFDCKTTLRLHEDAVRTDRNGCESSFMAMPQGRNLDEWIKCATRMVEKADDWGVRAIGITKFLEGMVHHRSEAILAVPGLIESDLDIHLLGCLGNDPFEAYITGMALRNRIRGVDSGMAAIWTQAGLLVGQDPRPKIELDFDNPSQSNLLLRQNIIRWKNYVCYGVPIWPQ